MIKSDLVVCKQQRNRPAFLSVQSDQHLYYAQPGKYICEICCIQQSFKILASLCSLAAWFYPFMIENLRNVFSHRGPFKAVQTYASVINNFLIKQAITAIQ